MKRNKNFLRFLQLYGICIFLLSTQLTVVFAQSPSPSGSIASKMVHSNKSETSIFPNPATDILNIQLKNPSKATIILRGINGNILQTIETSEDTRIDISDLPNGIIRAHLLFVPLSEVIYLAYYIIPSSR